MTRDELKKGAFDRLHSWNDKKAELLLIFTFDVPRNRFFQIQVTVFGIRDDHSSITLNWLRRAIDPADHFLFAETQGHWGHLPRRRYVRHIKRPETFSDHFARAVQVSIDRASRLSV